MPQRALIQRNIAGRIHRPPQRRAALMPTHQRTAPRKKPRKKSTNAMPTMPEATTLPPRPDQKANPTGFANPKTAPVAKSPRVEGDLVVEDRRGARAS